MSTITVALQAAVVVGLVALGVFLLVKVIESITKKKNRNIAESSTDSAIKNELEAIADEQVDEQSLFDRQPYWDPTPVMREEQLQGNGGWKVIDAIPDEFKMGIHSRGYVSTWRKIGALESVTPLDPTVLALYARPAHGGRLQYMVSDEHGAIIELYDRPDVRNYDYQRAFARSGNILQQGAIPSKEPLGAFRVLLFDEPDRIRYKNIHP